MHGLVLHGWELQKARMSLVCMGWMATSNLVGAALYATRVRSLVKHINYVLGPSITDMIFSSLRSPREVGSLSV